MKTLNIDIRKMETRDLPAVLEVENLVFKAPWKQSDFLYEMNDNQYANIWVIELSTCNEDKTVVGYCDYWQTFDSATICKIGVHPTLQHRQLGTAMMDEIINDCYAKRIRNLTLEVRKSNQNAINFYKKQGFRIVLEKPKYYSNGEDAYYMMQEININA